MSHQNTPCIHVSSVDFEWMKNLKPGDVYVMHDVFFCVISAVPDTLHDSVTLSELLFEKGCVLRLNTYRYVVDRHNSLLNAYPFKADILISGEEPEAG